MSVRAKFYVSEKADRAKYGGGAKEASTVRLSPANGEANKTWSQWTPSGSIELQINNPEALDAFKLGEHYFIDFTPAPATEAGEKAASSLA